MAKHWYVIRVASNREERVRDNLLLAVKRQGLEDRITEVLVPTETVTEIKRGKKKLVHRKIFPGYIMVNMEMDDEVMRRHVELYVNEYSLGYGASGRKAIDRLMRMAEEGGLFEE